MTWVTSKTWGKFWDDEQIDFVTSLMNNIRFELAMTDYEPEFMTWSTEASKDGAFVSFGLKKKGKQENGNPFSTLFNFGFYYREAETWPEGYIEDMIPETIKVYEKFLYNNQVESFRHVMTSIESGCTIRDIVQDVDPLS